MGGCCDFERMNTEEFTDFVPVQRKLTINYDRFSAVDDYDFRRELTLKEAEVN
jgi:hypothetical protein